jgi:uncharacterized protein (DUF1330 family)
MGMSDAAAIAPKAGVFQNLIERVAGPVVMVNLLKFKQDAGDGRTGAEAYAAYGAAVTEIVQSYGGDVVWGGRPEEVFFGEDGDNDWDAVLLVRYPSAEALAAMSASPEYGAVWHHRIAGLERTKIFACSQTFVLGQ